MMQVPAEPEKSANPTLPNLQGLQGLQGLQERYDTARALLEYHLLADTQYKKDNRAPISTAIKARRAAAEALETSAVQEAETAIKELEHLLKGLPPADTETVDAVTDRFDRFVAWYNGDQAATVPPALPEPPSKVEPKQKAAAKDKAAKTAAKSKQQKATTSNESRPELKAPKKSAETQALGKPRRWIRRIAVMLLLVTAISGLRLPDRRAELAKSLVVNELIAARSMEQAQLWFKTARWVETSGILYSSLAHDTQVVSANIAESVAALLEDPDEPRMESEAALTASLEQELKVQEQRRQSEIAKLENENAEWEDRYQLLEEQLEAVQERLAEAEQKQANADEDGSDAFLRLEHEFVQRDQQAKALAAELERMEIRMRRMVDRAYATNIIIGSLETLVDTSSPKAVRFVQNRLLEFDYDPGEADGKMGRKTRDAIREYQRLANLPATGEITPELISSLARNSDG